MKKSEFIEDVARRMGTTKKEADFAVKVVFEAITEALQQQEKLQFIGFGTFEAKKRAARICRNPSTGESIEMPEMYIPTFKAGKTLKDAVK